MPSDGDLDDVICKENHKYCPVAVLVKRKLPPVLPAWGTITLVLGHCIFCKLNGKS